ncbi:MAG: hypothetical protein QMD85_00825 [Candidatus Aenigmarchaeota archaeon]|nr:hypothetical protein [Candidatus Aenigmarchaeota archaeon]MDI6722077.1 hypothetical protein [Candidatus Aenigmarchaeota archaeon]
MITIVDNGRGAAEISRLIRSKSQTINPNDIKKDLMNAFILSDGSLNKESQKSISKIIETSEKPVLGIGIGMAYMTAFYGARIKQSKANEKQESVSLKKPSPLLLDFKRVFTVMKSNGCVIEELPENFSIHASSKDCEFEVIQEMEKPFFGVHFNPELGQDGARILSNFEKFIEVWEKYHK